MLADLSLSAVLLLTFVLGVGSGRWLHQWELRRDRLRAAQRCREEAAPMVRAWLESHAAITVGATAAELYKYLRHGREDVVDAVRVTLDRLVDVGDATRELESGALYGGYYVYRSTRKAVTP